MNDDSFTEEEYDFYDIGQRYAESARNELQKKYFEYKMLYGPDAAREFWMGATSTFKVFSEPSEETLIGADGFAHGSLPIPDTPPEPEEKKWARERKWIEKQGFHSTPDPETPKKK